MKVQVRRGVFETNSSSTHSLTMCSKSDYDKWARGEMLLNESYGLGLKGDFVTREEAINALIKNGDIEESEADEDIINDMLKDAELYTSDEWDDRNDEYEHFSRTYKTKSGEEVVSFGYYGYN